MFEVRNILPNDLPTVHRFTINLLRHHLGQYEQSHLNEDQLSKLFQEGYLEGILLTRNVENKDETTIPEPIGCMIFHSDVSLPRGGSGVLLDQFYIEPEFRGCGLGRRMMQVLCQRVLDIGGHYIKLVYQDGLGLDPVYKSMGFRNCSASEEHGLHLFEAYGTINLSEFLTTTTTTTTGVREYEPQTSDQTSPMVLVLSLTPSPITTATWSHVNPGTSSELQFPRRKPPGAKLTIVTRTNTDQPGMCPEALMSTSTKLCMFVEQCSVCSWLGPMVNFSDFVGDTTILDADIWIKRIQAWMTPNEETSIKGAVWEVPVYKSDITESCERQGGASEFSNALSDLLTSCNIPDDTLKEGWNLAYLDERGMHELVARTKPLLDSDESRKRGSA